MTERSTDSQDIATRRRGEVSNAVSPELNSNAPSAAERARLAGLLGFARGLLQASGSALHRMRSTGLGCFDEAALDGLPGLALDRDDGSWLRLARLHAEPAPRPPDEIAEWLDGYDRATASLPTVRPVQVLDVSIEMASDLCEGGLLALDDVHDIGEGATEVRVGLRLDHLDEVREAVRDWIDIHWTAWVERQRPTLASIAIYERLFQLYNRMHGGADVPPEFVWGTGVATWRASGFDIEIPLIEQPVDLELEDDGTLVVMPRALPPSLNLAPFHEVDAVASKRARPKLDATLAALIERGDGVLSPFVSSDSEPLLSQAASLLAVDGRCVTRAALAEGETVRGSGPTLEIVSSWALYARPRTVGARSDDLQRLGAGVFGGIANAAAERSMDVPPGLLGFVRELSDTAPKSPASAPVFVHSEGAAGRGRDGAGAGASTGARGDAGPAGIGYYFPLPYNEEQARIVDTLERSSVVTVTGPPGTGKTHTIANIISHYMATGRRVLVTARTAEAIAAVREKLPDELAALVIASVGSDREGTRQLEDAIERLSDEVVSLDERMVRETADRLEARIGELDFERAELDRRLAGIASENLAPFEWNGRECSAMDVAAQLEQDDQGDVWFEDRPEGPPPTDLAATVEALKVQLPLVAEDLAYLDVLLPDLASVPGTAELVALHRTLRRRRAEPAEDLSDQPPMARDTQDAEATARDLLERLGVAERKFAALKPWVRTAIGLEIRASLAGRRGGAALAPVVAIAHRFEHLSPGVLSLDASDIDPDAMASAIDRACAGEKPLSRFERLRSSELARALDGLRIDGEEPISARDWQRVRDTLRVEASNAAMITAWDDASSRLSLPGLSASTPGRLAAIRECAAWQPRIVKAAATIADWAEPLEALFPFGLDVRDALCETRFDVLAKALRANLDAEPAMMEPLERLRRLGEAGDLPLHQAFRTLHAGIGDPDLSEQEIVQHRGALTEELARLGDRRSQLDQVAALLSNLGAAGAPAWAEALRARPGASAALLPDGWRESWSRARLRARLERLDGLGNGDEHLVRKREIAADREKLLRELIRVKTLLGLRPRMSERVRAALVAFTTAVRRYGRGTGAQAGRWRRDMRESAEQASRAAPVWIMPEYKIAEQLPSELGSFDLVVLDEASQCDVTSIASLARGARCLIVGDEKQVSPSSVGVPIERVDLLRAEFLADLPARNRIDQDTSIFDLACQAYPSSHLMLREHFRCVEPIIRFSTRFYQGRLVPLRIPRASERFDPPLVDMHVDGAQRDGYLNWAEADVIVDEIAALVRDPAHATRDIAVISLIGAKQAEAIEKRLISDARVGTEAMKRHNVICGDARTLQGQERSIVFLSMVAVANERGGVRAQSDRDIQQRMNVAMSRARDRLYLVRSVTLDQLKPGDIKRDILLHFEDPMPDGGEEVRVELLDRCESGFERDVFSELANAGYRVRPQVKAGPFRIDLVVEGENDRRLAIELDGDRWHGPDVWERDMRRQASLERAGWTFWRVFGSQWVTNREHHWTDLVDTLGRLGIEPIGAAETGERLSELRRFVVEGDGVRMLGVQTAGLEALGNDLSTETAVSPRPDALPDNDVTEPVEPVEQAVPAEPTEWVTHSTMQQIPTVAEATPDVPAERASETDFYADDYRPRLAVRLADIVDARGPIDLGELCRAITEEHGMRRVGHVIRETVRSAIAERRALTMSRSGDHETAWPAGSIPEPCIAWIDRPADVLPSWDSLCWPARVGLVEHVRADAPENVHRAVLARLANRRLTKGLRGEIDRAAVEMESAVPDESIDHAEISVDDSAVPQPRSDDSAPTVVLGEEAAADAADTSRDTTGWRADGEVSSGDRSSARRTMDDGVAPWIRRLLESEVYAARSRAAGSRALTQGRMSALLSALNARGGRLFEASLARELGVPSYRVRGLIAAARTVLNVDGVEILSVDGAISAEERSVRLDRVMLARQFALDAEDSTVA